MSAKRVPLSMKVRPEIKAVIERFAIRERRNLNNLSELLLEWAAAKLEQAGSTLILLDSEDPNLREQVEMERKLYEKETPARKGKQRSSR